MNLSDKTFFRLGMLKMNKRFVGVIISVIGLMCSAVASVVPAWAGEASEQEVKVGVPI